MCFDFLFVFLSYCELAPASKDERDKKTALKIIFSQLAIPDSEFMIGHTQVHLASNTLVCLILLETCFQ